MGIVGVESLKSSPRRNGLFRRVFSLARRYNPTTYPLKRAAQDKCVVLLRLSVLTHPQLGSPALYLAGRHKTLPNGDSLLYPKIC